MKLLLSIAVALLCLCSCNAQTQSNETCSAAASDLQKLWNAAHNQIFLHGEYRSIYQSASKDVAFLDPIGLCVPNPNSWAFPDMSSQAIARIIQNGEITMCNPADFTPENDPENFNFASRIVFYINQHYNTSLNATFVGRNTSNDCFDALKNGSVDVVGPNFSLGVFIGDIPRTDIFAASCPHVLALVGIAVSENVTASDWRSFLATYGLNANGTNNSTGSSGNNTNTIKIGTAGFGSYLAAKGLFPNQDVILLEFDDFTAAFDRSDVDVLFDVGSNDFSTAGLGLHRNARFILTDVPLAGASFFRYNNC